MINVKNIFGQIPIELKHFLFKAVILFVAWSLLYDFYLQPKQILDPYFTSGISNTTAFFLQKIYNNKPVIIDIENYNPVIFIGGIKTLGILDGCNGLELYVLYLGFIACMPSAWKNMLKFSILGVIGIFVLNVIRCVVLACLQQMQFAYIDTVHHYVFTIVVYSFIFFLWVVYLKYAFKYKGNQV